MPINLVVCESRCTVSKLYQRQSQFSAIPLSKPNNESIENYIFKVGLRRSINLNLNHKH